MMHELNRQDAKYAKELKPAICEKANDFEKIKPN